MSKKKPQFDPAKPKSMYSARLKVKAWSRIDDTFAFSFNSKNPDVGSFVSAVYERDKTNAVFFDGGWINKILTPREQKTFERIAKKLQKSLHKRTYRKAWG